MAPVFNPLPDRLKTAPITSYESLKMTHGYVEARVKLPEGHGLWPAFWMLPTHYIQDVPEIDIMGTQDFHTFGMAWSPTEIIYYIDGEETQRITKDDYTIPNQSMYLIANLAVGGNWPGFPAQFPATFEIDYIRAYKRKLDPELNLAVDYQLMFEDDFDGPTLDETKWNTSFLWGPYLTINDEEQYYVDAHGADKDSVTPDNTPFVINDGILSITARQASDENSFPIPSELPDENQSIWGNFPTYRQASGYSQRNYSSGIITSYDAFKTVHGYAEMRARIPKGQGLWPAFWLLNGYYVGQQPEIDILEVLGHQPNVEDCTAFQNLITAPQPMETLHSAMPMGFTHTAFVGNVAESTGT